MIGKPSSALGGIMAEICRPFTPRLAVQDFQAVIRRGALASGPEADRAAVAKEEKQVMTTPLFVARGVSLFERSQTVSRIKQGVIVRNRSRRLYGIRAALARAGS